MSGFRWFAGLSLVALVATDASGYSAPGHKWPMTASPVSYRFHPDGSPDVTDGSDLEAMRRAFATWESVTCSWLAFKEEAWADPITVARDDTNRIFWVNDAGLWPGNPTTLALTYTFFRQQDLVVTDADIILNGVNWDWTTTDAAITGKVVDVETVVFHEIGHFFGLDHSQDNGAVMFPTNNVPIRRTPASDDINGICHLYSNGQQVPMGGSNGNQMGQVGSPCQANEDCASNKCIQDGELNRVYCTAECNPQDQSSCVTGYPCTQTASGNLCLAPITVDELCDQCSEGNQCATGLCLNVPGYNQYQPFCTRACDPTPGLPAQCPSGFHCEPVVNGLMTGGVCAPTTGVCSPVGKGGHNEPCFANGGCKSGHTCIQYYLNSGLNFCFFECGVQFAGQSCAENQRVICQPVSTENAFGRMNTAACFNISGVGEPCIPEVCESGSVCAFDDNSGINSAVCYASCPTGQCPANTQCLAFEGLGPVCVPNDGFKYIGTPCTNDAECQTSMCRTFLQHKLCTQNCATTDVAGCPNSTRCEAPMGQTAGLCWPETVINGSAPDPTRTVQSADPMYCACDTTTSCDSDCACDPECGGLTDPDCGCTVAKHEPASGAQSGLLMLLIFALCRRSRPGRSR